ncbi:uncharacterized protein LOC123263119 [Cotesia glomerata]|uniref:Uncharacterized protein n=1 Tax=Cotesia glomerata TaxID=32391 RepID=A0AAV7IL75_COTGL|nr:uncharacterized protein LOC123263119 [Cotesia glomerata]KAH0554823.1 hypothetical protein KQX54_012902 [Cotesia glomerata]
MLSLFIIKVEEERINTDVKLLMDTLRHDIYFIDLKDFCVHVTNITQEIINKNYNMEKIVDEYNKLLLGVDVQMMKEEWNNFCGRTMAMRFGIYDYYKTVMQSYLRIFEVYYYSLVIYGHCTGGDPRQVLIASKSKFLDNFKKTLTSTKNTIHETNHFMYLCSQPFNGKLFGNTVQLQNFQKMPIGERNFKPKGRSVIAVSLGEQMSDTTNNWIVAGVRFIEDSHMVYVQILEGLVSVSGEINMTRWRKVEENGDFVTLEEGRENGHAKKINLGDVVAPLEYVVTGVRFRCTFKPLAHPTHQNEIIQLEIHATKFDFLRGKLEVNNSGWISASLNSREEIAPKDFTLEKVIEFQTSARSIDAGQSTVPFFDDRDLVFSPPAPLQGLGLFHYEEKNKDFGGYFAFRAFEFDMSTIFFGL